MTPEHTALVARLVERANYTSSLPEKVLELDAAAALREQAQSLKEANEHLAETDNYLQGELEENATLRAEVARLTAANSALNALLDQTWGDPQAALADKPQHSVMEPDDSPQAPLL